ncbi:histidine kinase [Amnibacterium sp.]|uniref:sensor histidine kinase n=1 Tax=Amnibacterium sp. TaxID=1872496 RepID=UPI00261F47D2|nr:histidine kinase [Amnibacterium sp.]MCU1475126.1 ATP-binding protein [Amnibacterium sp.]
MLPPSIPGVWGLAATGVLALLAVVFLVLWLRSSAKLRRSRRELADDDTEFARLELSVADQSGRLRIIRELHDLAVHRVSAMIAQADGARYAGASDPTAAVRAAHAIAETGRATLADMRRVMTLVRESEAEALPQPRLKSTRELLKVMRDAGLQVQFEEAGEPYDLNSGAELAVYRILQEALSNCLKYGGDGTEVRVAFTWTANGLAVRVDDNGFRNAVLRRGLGADETAEELAYTVEEDLKALTQEVTGRGITEMRARAELFGGIVTANEVPGVGFSIAATFPTIRFHNGVHGVDLTRR